MSGGHAGRKGEFKVSADGGTTWLLVPTTSISWDPTLETTDTTENGDTGRGRLPTIMDCSAELEMNNKLDSDAGQQALEAEHYDLASEGLPCRYYPIGSAGTGYEFTGLVTSMPQSGPADGKNSLSATIENSGGNQPTTGVAYE